MRILFFASYPDLPIGYSRIGNIISNYLATSGHEIYYFGISNYKSTEKVDRFIHPNITLIDGLEEEAKLGNNELYGVNSICDHINIIKPDILFLYNDLIVISRIFNNFIQKKIELNFKIITYLDLVYPYEKINLIRHIDKFSDKIFVFSKYWKDNLLDIGLSEDKVDILPHGFDKKKFFPIDISDARKYFNFQPDDFIILNSNRNTYRKGIDKTIDAFICFLKKKNLASNIKLFLNMETINSVESGYDILNQFEVSCIKNKIDFNYLINNHIFIKDTNNLKDYQLNYLYNACDIGINTCVGEGFGLCNLEHGGIGKPQIVSDVGGLSDIFESDYSIKIEPIGEYYVSNHTDYHGGYCKISKTDDYVDALDQYYENKDLLIQHGLKSENILSEKFNWDKILEDLGKKINEIYYKKL
jgi:glycosyltransferase involved in cell wall biosynthesis